MAICHPTHETQASEAHHTFNNPLGFNQIGPPVVSRTEGCLAGCWCIALNSPKWLLGQRSTSDLSTCSNTFGAKCHAKPDPSSLGQARP